jgi:hypothetical protein
MCMSNITMNRIIKMVKEIDLKSFGDKVQLRRGTELY